MKFLGGHSLWTRIWTRVFKRSGVCLGQVLPFVLFGAMISFGLSIASNIEMTLLIQNSGALALPWIYIFGALATLFLSSYFLEVCERKDSGVIIGLLLLCCLLAISLLGLSTSHSFNAINWLHPAAYGCFNVLGAVLLVQLVQWTKQYSVLKDQDVLVQMILLGWVGGAGLGGLVLMLMVKLFGIMSGLLLVIAAFTSAIIVAIKIQHTVIPVGLVLGDCASAKSKKPSLLQAGSKFKGVLIFFCVVALVTIVGKTTEYLCQGYVFPRAFLDPKPRAMFLGVFAFCSSLTVLFIYSVLVPRLNVLFGVVGERVIYPLAALVIGVLISTSFGLVIGSLALLLCSESGVLGRRLYENRVLDLVPYRTRNYLLQALQTKMIPGFIFVIGTSILLMSWFLTEVMGFGSESLVLALRLVTLMASLLAAGLSVNLIRIYKRTVDQLLIDGKLPLDRANELSSHEYTEKQVQLLLRSSRAENFSRLFELIPLLPEMSRIQPLSQIFLLSRSPYVYQKAAEMIENTSHRGELLQLIRRTWTEDKLCLLLEKVKGISFTEECEFMEFFCLSSNPKLVGLASRVLLKNPSYARKDRVLQLLCSLLLRPEDKSTGIYLSAYAACTKDFNEQLMLPFLKSTRPSTLIGLISGLREAKLVFKYPELLYRALSMDCLELQKSVLEVLAHDHTEFRVQAIEALLSSPTPSLVRLAVRAVVARLKPDDPWFENWLIQTGESALGRTLLLLHIRPSLSPKSWIKILSTGEQTRVELDQIEALLRAPLDAFSVPTDWLIHCLKEARRFRIEGLIGLAVVENKGTDELYVRLLKLLEAGGLNERTANEIFGRIKGSVSATQVVQYFRDYDPKAIEKMSKSREADSNTFDQDLGMVLKGLNHKALNATLMRPQNCQVG